jgi:putative flippase GtrA
MRLPSEALRFLVAGGIAALINVIARILFSQVLSYGVAIVLAYLCGMVVAFLLNRYVVFSSASSGAVGRQSLRFAIVNAVSLVQVWIIGEGLVRVVMPQAGWHWHPQTTAHCIAVATPALVSYFAHKYFSFRVT